MTDSLPTRFGAAPYQQRSVGQIEQVVVHYTGVPQESTPLEIALWQVGKNNGELFPGIAYHFVVTRDGAIYQTQRLTTVSWHAGGGGAHRGVSVNNWRSVGVCLTGMAQDGWPTEAQVVAVRALIVYLREVVHAPLPVKGHQEVSPTRCPGEHFLGGWKQMLLP